MADMNQNTDETTSDPSSSAAPNGNPEQSDQGGPPGTTSEPPRWVAGQHSSFAGRSAEEILGIAEAQAAMLNRPVQVQMPQQQFSRFDMDIADDDYVDGKRLKQIVSRFANNAQSVDYGARQQAAGALLATVEMRRTEEFKRWGMEIRQELVKLDPGSWTLDNLNIVVDIVKSRHIDELAAEKAQRLVNESHPTIRSGTGGTGSGVPYKQQNMESEGVPREWSQAAKAAGISEQQIWEFCQAAGISEQQYYADLIKYGKGGHVHG
jgi:hypothetical protein